MKYLDKNFRDWMDGNFLSQFAITKPEPLISWATQNISFNYDVTASIKYFAPRPYQTSVLQAADDGCEKITCVMSQRLGKSLLWKIILAHRLEQNGGQAGLVVYQSLDEAERANRDTLEPIFKAIPKLRRDMELPHSKTSDSYHFADANSVVWFSGSGSPILSKSICIAIGDEVSYWSSSGAGKGTSSYDNVQMLHTRTMTYKGRGRLVYLSGTPTTDDEPLWLDYQDGSREEYHLKCLHCGMDLPCSRIAYPLKDGTYAGLQWKKDDEKIPIADSIVFLCPRCRQLHHFQEAVKMVEAGGYIAEHPERMAYHRSFHANALACPWTWDWMDIACKQEKARFPEARQVLRNTILALPISNVVNEDDDTKDKVRAHCRPIPKHEDVAFVLASVDVQGGTDSHYFIYGVRAYCDNGDNQLVAHGLCQNIDELDKVLQSDYMNHKVFFTGVDKGGFDHRATKMEAYVLNHPRVVWMKGDTKAAQVKQKKIDYSETVPKLLLHDSIHYKTMLLDAIYAQVVQTPDGNYWMLPDDIDNVYIAQIKAMRPSPKRQNGEAFQNWLVANSERHDYFDVEKMLLGLVDFLFLNVRLPELWPKKAYPTFIKDRLCLEVQLEEAAGNIRK